MAKPRRYTPEQYQRMAEYGASERARGSNLERKGGCGPQMLVGCLAIALIATANIWLPKVVEKIITG